MLTITETEKLRELLIRQRASGSTIGLIPTMGHLHAGHLKLVSAAVKQCDFAVSTIFVNPLQFGSDEDLETYPRSLSTDQEKLRTVGCNLLFAPTVEAIYGTDLGSTTTIHIPELSEIYCGRRRPGHFDGVATIVCKLFNIVQPHKAYFGLKDYQQFLLIQRLATDLAFNIEIEGIEIERDEAGLALSSRNAYLSHREIAIAPRLYRCLCDTASKIVRGERDYRKLEKAAIKELSAAGFDPDYLAICNAHELTPASELDSSIVILAAAHLGACRLIDNVRLQVKC
ncbi:MAG: pantoate--beta-alanine ligase [Gammaproteobacteria bacterium]|nr:pantoate--beta-alanine ligase [Gammaproteobacteria bacterium]HJN95143.1 pantoate--beta-alanine ligase [Gammaproteobacteria bacterium]|tara:strand:- start:44 stop:898 length:855 start_codon:yes stop_codon:yes gene_type:complete